MQLPENTVQELVKVLITMPMDAEIVVFLPEAYKSSRVGARILDVSKLPGTGFGQEYVAIELS